jgi:alanine dehydrogenase
VTLPYALQIANKGWKKALADSPELAKGLNVSDGHVTYRDVAELFGYPVTTLESQISA